MNFHDDADVLAAYVVETLERLSNIEVTILRLKERPEAYDEQIRVIFRDAHSVKSGANLLKLKNIEKLAHNLENILHIFREKRIIPNDNTISTLLEAIDKIRELTDNIKRSEQKNITLLISKLQALCQYLDK
ncbi:Hpt domain-containing protein [Candidatus Magnetominusculus xianensis]|uniref:Chemotaxis protein CheA n=1 Tax=Candidatus Magnetominusculus xianensis TaxID=1748249 RepID=A0ABR5SJ56_9BACT|nr:Hpt domain-containing protein [Candidatus Magnetominusculus xianensis]KWT93567.1 chemotaxis protein CheA [Candidatus Magnetominusculus xianensis]MBF0405356.1 Hpt domain-containing protein [Nitrospirota bacterium]